jgi:Rps23 Pro-64 3,4-dihydroxylase Tpa1-like proline 4-hydroxylase
MQQTVLTPSLTEYLDLVKPFVSSQLIDAQSWREIEAIAQLLPSQLTSFFGFECRLGNPEAKADFLLCVGADETGQKMLAGGAEFPDRLLHEPAWAQIRNFAAVWQEQASSLHQKVNNIWLEFDVAAGPETESARPPIPSCFFGSQAIYADPTATAYPHLWVTRTAIELLRGNLLPPAVEQKLFHCLDALPTGAYVFQVGLMLARCSDFVRICIRGISPAQILDYLSQIGWSGSTQHLQTLLTELSEHAERIDLDLDIGEMGVADKIGLECYLSRQPKYEPKWQAFLEYLVQTGLCLPQKQEALLSYPGQVREKRYREQWPLHLSKLSRFLGDGHEGVFMRGLHHIKVVYQSEQAVEAKAYCWVTHRLLNKQMFHQLQQFNQASVQLENFLTPEEHDRLLTDVMGWESAFVPSETLQNNRSETSDFFHRNSLVYNLPFPEVSRLLSDRIRQVLPEVLAQMSIDPFSIADIEAQLTAHNQGHYYKLHNDNGVLQTAARRITFVYYFHREPKSFTGGELRIFNRILAQGSESIPGQAEAFKLIQPLNNSIVFFPSHYFHEVLPVECPSKLFVDSRFTINGWLWQAHLQP